MNDNAMVREARCSSMTRRGTVWTCSNPAFLSYTAAFPCLMAHSRPLAAATRELVTTSSVARRHQRAVDKQSEVLWASGTTQEKINATWSMGVQQVATRRLFAYLLANLLQARAWVVDGAPVFGDPLAISIFYGSILPRFKAHLACSGCAHHGVCRRLSFTPTRKASRAEGAR